ncbi:hypothetical protein J7J39_02655 [bacterium]|nr:hypothetical protein [bacterium]
MIIGKNFFITVFILLLIGGFVRFELPFLYKERISQYSVYVNSGNIGVISDLHLDSNSRDLTFIGNYLNEKKIDYLVINGDLFEKKHNEKMEPVFLQEAMQRLNINSQDSIKKIIYIPALYDHDPYLEKTLEYEINGVEFLVVKGMLRLVTPEASFYILHGDYILRHGFLATMISILVPGSFEKIARRAIRADQGSWMVLAHSHISKIDQKQHIVNSGCWISRVVPSSDTLVLIKIDEKPDVSLIKVVSE